MSNATLLVIPAQRAPHAFDPPACCAGALVMAPTLLVPGVHLGLSGGFMMTADVRPGEVGCRVGVGEGAMRAAGTAAPPLVAARGWLQRSAQQHC